LSFRPPSSFSSPPPLPSPLFSPHLPSLDPPEGIL
jgi:hypothetical protein